ncbi:DUF2019 domain-containing protein [Marmoricola sp. OAE513]|uniref:DUF2019 domain-containing protein n=1 Tax=Marmoricola sp. OAE513 TaxID=2817894 RepID=UPI001AE2A9BF
MAKYRETAEAWAPLTTDQTRKANRLFDAAHELAKNLRRTDEGRAALLTLLDHAVPGVRMFTATECLSFDPGSAVPVLEAIERLADFHSLEAKYALKMFRDGTFDLDW